MCAALSVGLQTKPRPPLPCRCLCAPAVPRRCLLQNQTSARLPNTRHSQSRTRSAGRKRRVYTTQPVSDTVCRKEAPCLLQAPGQENWQLRFKRPELPRGFQIRGFFFFFSNHIYLFIAVACRILVLQPGFERTPSAVTARSPHHWTVGISRGKGL